MTADFEGDRACEGPGATHFGCACLRAENDRLATENARLRKALGWYADTDHYDIGPDACCRGCTSIEVEEDDGKRARAALRVEEPDHA